MMNEQSSSTAGKRWIVLESRTADSQGSPRPGKLSSAPSAMLRAMAASDPTGPSPLGPDSMKACWASVKSAAASANRLGRASPLPSVQAPLPAARASFSFFLLQAARTRRVKQARRYSWEGMTKLGKLTSI